MRSRDTIQIRSFSRHHFPATSKSALVYVHAQWLVPPAGFDKWKSARNDQRARQMTTGIGVEPVVDRRCFPTTGPAAICCNRGPFVSDLQKRYISATFVDDKRVQIS